jgi:hypothetical protein
MPAIFDRILTVNLVANTAIFYVAARLYLLPLAHAFERSKFLFPSFSCIQCGIWD